MRLAVPIAIVALAAALLAGCGEEPADDSGSGATAPPASTSTAPAGGSAHACPLSAGGAGGLRATGVSCGKAQRLAIAWRRSAECVPPAGASRSACTVGSYRCLAAATDRGLAVSCARPGRSVAFTARKP